MNLTSIQRAAEVIRQGGVVAYPTESCFGLGCDPRNHNAVRRILKMKRRPVHKGLILIADRKERFIRYIKPLPESHYEEILKSWPGPFTWILPSKAGVSPLLRGKHASLAVRVTAHRAASTLCRLSGMSLVSTSANRAGRKMLRTRIQVEREFGAEIDYVVDDKIGLDSTPSTIIHGVTGAILRG